MSQTRPDERKRGGSHKHVPLTDRRYVLRKVLSSTKPKTEDKCDVYRRDSTDMSFLPPQSFISPPSVSELRGRQSHEEHTFRLPLFSSRSSEQSLSGSIPEFEPLKRPLRHPLTSTVLNPPYTPQPGDLKSGQKEGRGWGRWGPCPTGGPSEGDLMSPHKANYWACAIPKDLPQSPDRHSAGWDPNKEYQALLDYTYPLRTNHLTCELDGSERLLQADMQDSGIELENICGSNSLSGLDISVSTEEGDPHPLGVSLTDLQGASTPSGCSPSDDLLFLTDPGSLHCSKGFKGQLSHFKSGSGHYLLQRHEWPCSISTALPRSTSRLHQPVCVCVEEDEEFRSLPEQLNELQLLSTQVRAIAAQLSRPVSDSWSLDPGTSSIFTSVTSPEKPEARNITREENSQVKVGKEERHVTHSAAAHRGAGRWAEPVGGRSSASGLRKVEALLKQLCDLTLHKSSQQEQEPSDSLLQHVQVFCSHLEQLIQYLYVVSEKMELLAQPAVDMTRLKLSLDEYQREVMNHLPLTSCVMHSGQLLLSCINTMSPFLRDTLQLVARESEALQSYNEHFSSILSAMDNLVK